MADALPVTDTSVYQPHPQPNPFATIAGIGQAADSLGNIAVGQSVQQAIDPDTGQIDRNKLAQLLKGTVAGSMKAIPTLNALETLRNAGYQADQQGLETFQKRMAITNHLFSGLASKEHPTGDDVLDVHAMATDPALEAKKYGITIPVIMNSLKQFKDPRGNWLPSAQIKQKALEIQTQAASTGEILHQHSPQVRMIQDGSNTRFEPAGTLAAPQTNVAYPNTMPPTATEATPQGNRYLGVTPPPAPVPTGPNFDQRFQPAIDGVPTPQPRPVEALASATGAVPAASPRLSGTPIAPAPVAPTGTPSPLQPAGTRPMQSLRPGYAEAATTVAQAGANQAAQLITANDAVPQLRAALGNLEEDLKHFTSGGAADWTRIAKNWANRNIPVPKSWQEAGAVLDPKSIAFQEQFNKQATMVAQQLFAAIGGTGTDAKFNSAFATSPNETLSQMGNEGILHLLKGLNDATQAKTTAWNAWKKTNGPDTYGEFSEDFNNRFDPRAFQFKYLKPAERQDYVRGMEPDERQRFLNDLAYAHKQGWVKF